MIRKILATLAVAAALTAPLRAELKYTMRMEVHKSTVPPRGEPDPIMAMLSAMVANALLPSGPVEMSVLVGPKGVRTEYLQAYTVMPAGTVTLVRPDGSMVVMNPIEKSYWKMAKPELGMILPGLTPQVTTKKTGTTAAVAGLPAEQVDIEVKIPLPAGATASLPAGFPTEFVLSGEMWVTTQFKDYAKQAASAVTGVASLGLDKIVSEGLLLRSVIRGALFGDQELESIVTKIGEEAADAALFEIPEGYKEVPPPAGIGGVGRGAGAGARRE
jgi:hypothetical protein